MVFVSGYTLPPLPRAPDSLGFFRFFSLEVKIFGFHGCENRGVRYLFSAASLGRTSNDGHFEIQEHRHFRAR